MIELVDFNEIYKKGEEKGSAKKTRRSGGARKKAADKAVEVAPAADTAAPAEEAPSA